MFGDHMRLLRRAIACALLFLLVLPAMVFDAVAQERRLFEPLSEDVAMSLSAEQERRVNVVAQDATRGPLRLGYVNADALGGSAVVVPLSDETTIRLNLDHRFDRGPGDFTWVGSTADPSGQSVLVLRENQITGVIYDGLDQYSLIPIGGGLHALTKIDPRAFPPDHPPGPLPRAPRDRTEQRGDISGDGPIEIDILGVYTPAASAAVADIVARIQLAVDRANTAYLASNANTRLRLVGTLQAINYSEAGKTLQTILNDARQGTGAMAPVHTQRDNLGADLVGVFVSHSNNFGGCGIGYVTATAPLGYSVTANNCIENETFAHEVGHNIGAAHDIANAGVAPAQPYGYGYIHFSPSPQWRTIMSYPAPCNFCPRLNRFSNPQQTHNGHAMGTPTQSDVARLHRERASIVAAFRATVGGTPAAITSPASGSTLPGSSVTFQWNAGSGAQAYWLHVGSTVGGSQYHDSGQLGTGVLSRNVTGLPTNGSTVRVRLFTRLSGAWQFNDYTYTAASPPPPPGTKAVMTSPASGSKLSGSSVTFQWSAGQSAQAYWLYVGSTVGGKQYHDSGQLGTGVLSRNVTGLPTNGSTVRVRLFTRLSGAWQFNDYTYTAATTGTKAVMTSPAPGTTLPGSTVTFQWSAGNNAQAYWLYVGSTVGGSQYHDSGQLGTGVRSRTVSGLPASGTIRVRLYTRLSGTWHSNDYTYTGSGKAVMSSPTPSSTLPGASVTFQWHAGTGAQAYWLYVGSTVGGKQYHDSGQLGTGVRSRTVSGLPASGTVRVRLFTRLGGSWHFNDYAYAGSGKATMTSPVAGTTLPGSVTTFQWHGGTGAQAYWLYVGSTVGGSQYHDSGLLGSNVRSRTVFNLPASGTVRVRLFTRLAGTWQFNDYTYTGSGKAVMSSPLPGSTLPSTTATFEWSAGTGAQAYWLYVGSTVGGRQYHDSGELGSGVQWRTVSGLPASGTVRVRLFTRLGGSWHFNDYVYSRDSHLTSTLITPSEWEQLDENHFFQWTAVSGATEYWVDFSTSPRANDIFNDSMGTMTSNWFSFAPHYDEIIHMRLWTRHGGAWRFVSYQFMGPIHMDSLGQGSSGSAGSQQARIASPPLGQVSLD